MNAYRKTGRLIDVQGLPTLREGGVYRVVESSPGLLSLEEVEAETILEPLARVRWGDVEVDPGGRTAAVGCEAVSLTRTEWKLLLELMRHPGRMVTNQRLLRRTWGAEMVGNEGYLRVWVSRLRAKLPGLPLETVFGQGYKLHAPEAGDG